MGRYIKKIRAVKLTNSTFNQLRDKERKEISTGLMQQGLYFRCHH